MGVTLLQRGTVEECIFCAAEWRAPAIRMLVVQVLILSVRAVLVQQKTLRACTAGTKQLCMHSTNAD